MSADIIDFKNKLGYGFYTSSDIAQLLRLPRAKVSRYLKQYWDERMGQLIFNDRYSWSSSDGNAKGVNFYVLIELYVFFRLQELGVTTGRILKAHENIAKERGTQYPFAHSGVLTDGKKIWYTFEDAIVNADRSRQTNFIKIIKEYAELLDFDQQNMAARYFPAGRGSQVVVDPHHQFGQPVVLGTNVNTEMLYSMYQSGEPVDSISILYDLTEREIMDAVNFHRMAA